MPFVPGEIFERPLPLERFLPTMRKGIITKWLMDHFPPGSWLVDPLGAHPWVSIEAAQAGYSILVTCNNPILAFLTEVLASAPNPADITRALSELASLKRGEERLENHIRGLYFTECSNCRQMIEAEGFLWRENESVPFAKIVKCPFCGEEGERPTTPADHQRLEMCGSDGLHRSRAAERICSKDDPLRMVVEDALRVYPRRPLYVLATLTNRLEGMSTTSLVKKLLSALIISACDEGNTLSPWPGGRSRPRQLSVPPVFRESNLWTTLEQAGQQWSILRSPLSVSIWPALPPTSGGICIFPGRLRSLVSKPPPFPISGGLSAVPRPNQAFWILCALWSGWLWGKEGASPLRGSLDRQRYDWNWHSNALYSAFSPLSNWLTPGTPVFSVVSEIVPGFLGALLIGAEAAGLQVTKTAVRSDQDSAQIEFQTSLVKIQNLSSSLKEICLSSMQSFLNQYGEPSDYLQLYAAGVINLSIQDALPRGLPQPPTGVYPQLQSAITDCFKKDSILKRFASQSQEPERALWWLENPPESVLPMKDRIEMELVRLLQRNISITQTALDAQLCELFPGFATPSQEWIELCLDSYAELSTRSPGEWQLKDQDSPANRKMESNSIRGMLHDLGKHLGFSVRIDPQVQWINSSGSPVYTFFVMASSLISRFLLAPASSLPLGQKVIVFPGGRSRLISYKLKLDPRLREAAADWHFMKFRHVRTLSERKDLNIINWESLLDSDPPFWNEAAQMTMF